MKLAVYSLGFLLLCLFYSCSSDTPPVDANGEPVVMTQTDKSIGYCYQLHNDVIEENLEIRLQGNQLSGQGGRSYRKTQTYYTLRFEGTLEDNTAEVTVYAQNARSEKEEVLIQREDWTLGDKQLLVERRSIEGQKGQFTYPRTRCQLYNNADNTLYDVFGAYKEGYAVVGRNGNFGLINEKGEETIPLKYRDLGNVGSGYLPFYDENLGLYGILDVNGTVMVQPKYAELMTHSEGLAAFMNEEGYWGFLDEELKEVIAPQFIGVNFYKGDVARKAFQEGLAKVQLENNRWSFINKKGDIVIPGNFIYAESFENGRARVNKDNKWYYINRAGDCVENCDE